MRTSLVAALVVVAVLAPRPAFGAWAADGNPVVIAPGEQYGIVAVPWDGGVLVGWESGVESTDIFLKALTAEGATAPGWPADGLAVCTAAGLQRWISIATDPAGAYVAWLDLRTGGSQAYLQRVTSDGAVAPGWPADGLLLGPEGWPLERSLASDGAGGVFAARVAAESGSPLRIHRITEAGATAAGWPPEGLDLGQGRSTTLLPDGAGGVFASWIGPDNRVRVQRIAAGGTVHPGWPAGGVVLGDQAYSTWSNRMLPIPAGGIYVHWSAEHDICGQFGPCGATYLTRLDGSGAVAENWAESGLALGRLGQMAVDGVGGTLFAWSEGKDLFDPYSAAVVRVIRLDGAGELAPGWIPGGNRVCTEDGFQAGIRVVGDGSGGALAAWWDSRTSESLIYVSRLDASGVMAAGWPWTGSIAAPNAMNPEELQLVEAGDGRAILVWVDHRYGTRDVFADAATPGPAGPPAPFTNVPPPVAFGVFRTYPNPAGGAFWAVVGLPEAGRASLELFDLAGRVVESTELDPQGPARGAVRLNASPATPAGIYWLRLRQGGHQATAKVILSR